MNAQEKQNKHFLSISHVGNTMLLCVFSRLLFSFVKAKKNPSGFIKFLHVWSTLKTFDVKQGLRERQMTRRY